MAKSDAPDPMTGATVPEKGEKGEKGARKPDVETTVERIGLPVERLEQRIDCGVVGDVERIPRAPRRDGPHVLAHAAAIPTVRAVAGDSIGSDSYHVGHGAAPHTVLIRCEHLDTQRGDGKRWRRGHAARRGERPPTIDATAG